MLALSAVLQAKLLEHNVRFGDPECQGLMARLDTDLVDALVKVGTSVTLRKCGLQAGHCLLVAVIMIREGCVGGCHAAAA